MSKCARVHVAGLFALLLAGPALAAPKLSIAPLGYQVSQLQPVPGTLRTYDLTARAAVVNRGDPAQAVTARLASTSPAFIVLDGDLGFGDVPRTTILRPVLSRDTFTLRIVLPPRRELLDFIQSIHSSLSWTLSCANCGGGNRPPLAAAGADQTAYVGQLVTLDGSGSSDPDAQALGYAWSFVTRPAGSTAALGGATSVQASFTPDREGDYVVRLIVNDGVTDSAPDTVQVSTLNSAPVAHAGPDQVAMTGQELLLDGSASSDVDGDPLTYAWSVAAAPPGSTAAIEDPTQVQARFTPDLPGQYVIELVVDDGTISSTADSLVISTDAGNTPPVANAGPDQGAQVGDTAQLDGSASSDADGDALSFRWSLNARPAQSAAVLQQADTATPAFAVDRPGTYVAQLIVGDGQADSAPDTVSVSTINSPPLARIAAPASVKWRTSVALDGTGSSDPDGDALGFSWSILSRPPDSQAVLSDAHATETAFTADRPGVYVVQLVVNDGQLDGAPATATVTASNQAPVAADDVSSTAQGAPVLIPVLDNDSDADGDALTIESLTQPEHGTATLQGDAIRYEAAAGFSGMDSFAYRATDGAASAPATVSVTVTALANGNPVANAGPDQTVPGGTTVQLDGSLSTDPDGDPLVYAWTMTTTPASSSATLSNAGTASPGFTTDRRGLYRISLTVTDGRGGSATDSVDITALNRDPVAAADSGTTAAGTATTIDVLANDSDPDGDALAIESITQPANGVAAIAGASVSFTPAAGFSGGTSFSYTASDGQGGTASAQVTVTVTGTPGEFNFALFDTQASGFAGSSTLVPFRVLRAPGTTGEIAVAFTGAPDGITTAGAIVPDGLSDGILEIAIGPELAPGSLALQLLAVAGSVSHTASLTLQVAAPQPPSIELIRAGMLSGALDRPTSLLYRAYALVGDARLPAAYRGSGSPDEDVGLFAEINEALPTLSPDMRAQLEPFVLRPSNPGSWYSQLLTSLSPAAEPITNGPRARSALLGGPTTLVEGDPVLPSTCDDDPAAASRWISTAGATNGFRVWAHCVPGHPRNAEIVVREAVKVFDVLWGPMSSDMGPPRPDLAPGTPIDPTNGVGDESIDIYLLYPGDVVERLGRTYGGIAHANGWAQTWRAEGGSASGFISIPVRTLIAPSFHVTAAHEVFHVLQFGHNYQVAVGAVPTGFEGLPNPPRLPWWYVEASAEWAGAHYDRTLEANLKRGEENVPRGRHALETYSTWFASGFQSRGSTIGLNAGGQINAPAAHLPYEAFIWPYFLEQESGDASRPAGQIWAAVAGATTPNAADERLDGVVPFATNMRKFAVRNLNNVAVGNRYEQLDPGEFPRDTPPQFIYQGHFRAGSPSKVEFPLTTLSAYYMRLDNDVEPGLRKLHLDLTGLDEARADLGIDVDLLLKLKGGTWQAAQDFNGTKKKTWCLDEEDVESMYLVISAHELKEPGVLTRSVSIEHSSSVAPCRPAWVGTSRLSSTQGPDVASTASAEGVTFELIGDEEEDDGSGSNQQAFALVAGGVAKNEQMLIFCERFPLPSSVPITIENSPGSMLVTYSPDGTQMTVTLGAATFYSGSVIADCSSGERIDQGRITASWLSFGNGITVPVPPSPAQQRIQGSFNVSVAVGTNSILTIDLALVRQ